MDDDDKPLGVILSRRDALKIMGIGSAATLLVACSPSAREILAASGPPNTNYPTTPMPPGQAVGNPLPACVVRPEMTEGPFFVDEMLNRSDIRNDPTDGTVSPGVPIELTFQISQINQNGCVPLENAQVDIWHCDAFGVYSDVQNAVGKKFLRGYQITDGNGLAKFITIYPGWYPGRAVHVHFKIRVNGYVFTSQLFFDDDTTDKVYLLEPYRQRGERTTRNVNDNIFADGGE